MKLERLELYGFKSFATKTSIAFGGEDISIVVGPNGSGKSNIADSIRWILGEQSAKSLRGSAMEDVIFNGSEEKSASGVASATLVFSDVEKTVSSRFITSSELSVTRKLYRSGESQYLINEQACRLLDIKEVFLELGIVGKGYSIIEQGQISQIINNKPEELRGLFDSAAGIAKFKLQRNDAEKKLSQTQNNLERVQDILTELIKREEDLREHVQKVDVYNETQGKIKRKSICISSKKWFLLKDEFDVIMDQRDKSQKQISTLKTELNNILLDEEKFRYFYKDLKEKLDEKRSSIDAFTENKFKYEKKLDLTKQSLENLNLLEKNEQRQREQAETKKAELENKKEKATTSLQEYFEIQESLEFKSRELTELKTKYENELREFRNEESALKKNERQNYDELNRVRSQKFSFEERRKQIDSRLNELEQSLEKKRKDQQEKESSLSNQFSEETEKENLLQELDEKIEDIQDKLEELKEQREETLEATQEFEVERQVISSQIESNKEFIENLPGRSEGAQKFKEYLNQNAELSSQLGFLGGLGEIISEDTPSNLPLNDYVNVLFFENSEKLIKIIKLYEGFEIEDELSLCFLNLLSPEQNSSSFFDLFKRTEKLESVLSNVSAQVLEGDHIFFDRDYYFDQNGIFKILKSEKADLGKLIKEKHTIIEELSSRLEFIKEEEDQKKELIRRLDLQIEENNEVLIELNSSYQATKEAFESLKSKRDLEQRLLDNLKKDIESELSLLKNLETQKNDLSEDHTKLDSIVEQLQQVLEKIEQDAEQLQLKVQNKEHELEDIKELYSESKLRAEGNRIEIKNLRKEIEDIENEIRSLQKSKNASDNEFVNFQQQRTEKIKLIDELTNELEGFEDKLEKDQQSLKQELKKLSSYEEKLEGCREEKQRLYQFQEEQQKVNHQYEVKIATLGQEAKTLEDNLMDEFALRPEEVLKTFDVTNFELETEEETVRSLKTKLKNLGNVNLGAKEEYQEVTERLNDIQTQAADLEKSMNALVESITKMNTESSRLFLETFNKVNYEFQQFFPRVFEGGKAFLSIDNEEDLLNTGVHIHVNPPGKKLQRLSLLSGGEKALSALILIFSVFSIKPSPFCLLDEVDAPLDDANIGRFNRIIQLLAGKSQFVVITHNKKTMEIANRMFGITMEDAGISKVLSLNTNEYLI